jgi:hypothetical protein
MARLKIFENNNPQANIPSKEGYTNVATGLINDFTNFSAASDRDRSDLLQGYAGKHTVYQLTRNPQTEVPINRDNCKINIVPDERKKPNVNFGKHNMALPELQPGEVLDTGYLSEHVKAIDALYGGGSAAELDRACKFMFGLMLLTRCR